MEKLRIEKVDAMGFLETTSIIDFDNKAITDAADFLTIGVTNEVEKVKRVFELVRDDIAHSFDINGQVVTCRASDVLKHKQGICYAKSHLVAALLRYLKIPTGFCYQKLVLSDEMPTIILHGLNAVYLKDIKQWIRLDARGNKEGVNAQFSTDEEQLAFSIRLEFGESDEKVVYAKPSKNAIAALQISRDLVELKNNLPKEV
jgi:transglutaminase-like putative cysteine protease